MEVTADCNKAEGWLESCCTKIAVFAIYCVLSGLPSLIALVQVTRTSLTGLLFTTGSADSSLTWHMMMSTVLPSTAQPSPSPSVRGYQAL